MPTFGLLAPTLGGAGRLRRTPWRRRRRGRPADQVEEPLAGVLAVANLGAEAGGGDDEHAVCGQPASREPLQALAHVLWQRLRGAHVEAQLYGGCNLVDVLPAGTRGAQERLPQLRR